MYNILFILNKMGITKLLFSYYVNLKTPLLNITDFTLANLIVFFINIKNNLKQLSITAKNCNEIHFPNR